MKRSILFLLFTSFIVFGCKKNETNSTEDDVLEIKGIIKLPTGMNQNISGYSLNSYRTEQFLSNNEYTVEVTKNDYNLQFLSDQAEKDIMIGFSYPNQTDFTIDANSTLLGLVMKLPSVNSLSSQGKLNFISKIKTSSKYSDALIAVENHIKSGKDILDTTDAIMIDKISQLFDEAALRRSGFGYSGQAYITKADKTITIGNPGVSFAQVIGIYKDNQRIAKLELDRYKFYVSSITEIPNAIITTPTPIEKSFTFTQDGEYEIKIRNGGFNPIKNDVESEEAIILNGINLVLDNLKVFLPVDVSAKCPSAIYSAVKAKVDASKSAMKVASDKTQFITLLYNITKATLNELTLNTYCGPKAVKYDRYTYRILKYIKWLDLVGKVGTNLNNTIFALEYFSDSKSALDTTITIGNFPITLTANAITNNGMYNGNGQCYGGPNNLYYINFTYTDNSNKIKSNLSNLEISIGFENNGCIGIWDTTSISQSYFSNYPITFNSSTIKVPTTVSLGANNSNWAVIRAYFIDQTNGNPISNTIKFKVERGVNYP